MDSQKTSIAVAVVAALAVVAFFLGGLVFGPRPSASSQASVSDQTAASADSSSAITSTSSPSMSTITTSDGLQITDETIGSGPAAKAGDHVYVNYVGTLSNGQKFDSSYDRGTPIDFVLGTGYVIKGWDEGLVGMKVGGKRSLVIPPQLGYGARAIGPIPANSTLHFEVELVKIGQ